MQAKSLVPVVAALLLAASGGPAGASSGHPTSATGAGAAARPDSPAGRADFDSDGFADLAVGAPGETLVVAPGNIAQQAGIVHVLRGSTTGVTGSGSQAFTQESAGIASDAEPGDSFGTALSALDSTVD